MAARFPVLLYNTNPMAASQSLFRRHRNRDMDVNGIPAPSSSGDGGGDNESPSENVDTSERRNNVDSNNRDTTSNIPSTSSNHALNISSPTDDEEQELVVQIPDGHPNSNSDAPSPFVLPSVAWEPSVEATALRREAIHQEVLRVQRANFIHFLVLCLVPTTLLLIVIAAIVSEDGECGSTAGLTVCEREPRSFVNAFTSRCICDAVTTVVAEGLGLDGE